jgi:hypothetical protein
MLLVLMLWAPTDLLQLQAWWRLTTRTVMSSLLCRPLRALLAMAYAALWAARQGRQVLEGLGGREASLLYSSRL